MERSVRYGFLNGTGADGRSTVSITENFGNYRPPRWISRDTVAHVWRPSLPMPK